MIQIIESGLQPLSFRFRFEWRGEREANFFCSAVVCGKHKKKRFSRGIFLANFPRLMSFIFGRSEKVLSCNNYDSLIR